MPELSDITAQLRAAKTNLDAARELGDQLRVDLAEATLNHLIDHYSVTLVACNKKEAA